MTPNDASEIGFSFYWSWFSLLWSCMIYVTMNLASAEASDFQIFCLNQFGTAQIGSANNGLAQLTQPAQIGLNGSYSFIGNSSVRLTAGICYDGTGPGSLCQCEYVSLANAKSTTASLQTAGRNTGTSSVPMTSIAGNKNLQTNVSSGILACNVAINSHLVGGTTYTPITKTLVQFKSLQTWVAGRNLRLYFIGALGFSTSVTFSNQFVVNPGQFQRLTILDEPANGNGCARCPTGTYLAGSLLHATVALQDAFNNTIALICTNSTSCWESTQRAVVVEYPQQIGLIVAAKVISFQGVASFSNLTVFSTNDDVMLSFTAPLVGSFGSIVSVTSQPFIVTNAGPFKPKPLLSIFTCANNSLFLPSLQPQVEILDFFDNRVVSDCFDRLQDPECSGSVSAVCSAIYTACNPSVTAQIPAQTALLTGSTTSFSSVSGLATFTDLGVVSLNSMCETISIVIRFSIQNLATTADQTLVILPGASRLNIVNQPPSLAVADEIFSTPVEVQVLDCRGMVTSYDVSKLNAIVNNAPLPGILRGQTTVSAQSGFFIFTDLSLYIPAQQLSLSFDYIGFGSLSPAISSTFNVYAPPTGLKILRQPSAENPTQPTEAGFVFWLQPQIQLVPALPTTRSVTAAIIPGWDPGSLQWQDPGISDPLSGNIVAYFDAQGIAQFTDLSVYKASLYQGLQNQDYKIRFSSEVLQIDSATFQIFPSAWAALFIPNASQPITSVAASPLLIQPTVCLVDQFRNLILQVQPVIVSVTLKGPSTAILLLCSKAQSCNPSCTNDGCNYGEITESAVNSVAQFSNLAIEQAFESFRLFFSTSKFNVTSNSFAIVAGNIVSLIVSNISAVSSADTPLLIQPVLTVADRKGNIVDMPVDSEISYELRTPDGYIPEPGVPAPDAIPYSMCTTGALENVDPFIFSMTSVIENSNAIFSQTAAQFTSLTVHRAMMGYHLRFTLISAARVFTTNSTEFSIVPGVAIGICAISVPDLCAVLAPCHQKGSIVCIDKYDNVQPSCKRCQEAECEIPTFINTSVMQNELCPSNEICVKLYSGPDGGSLLQYGGGTSSTLDCAVSICSSLFVAVDSPDEISSGGASFTNIVMNVSSLILPYRLIFFTFTTNPTTLAVEKWIFITPNITVQPPPPIVDEVLFTATMNQIQVLFNEDTNMNVILGEPLSMSCDAELDQSFLVALGANPFCTWPSPSQLLISLGYGAYVNTTTRFYLNPMSQILAKPIGKHEYSYLLSLQEALLPCTTVEGAISAGKRIGEYYPRLPSTLPIPNPQIISKDFMSACDLFGADARLSTGYAKRAFQRINWGINFTSTRFKNGILQSGRGTRMFKTHIQVSSMLPNDMNTVNITLMFNGPVLPGSIFVISGFPEYVKPSQKEVSVPIPDPVAVSCFDGQGACIETPLQGQGASLFAKSVVQWSLQSSDLILQVNGSLFLPSLEDIVFTFSMQNPSFFIPASAISIFSKPGNGTGLCLDPESVTCYRSLWYTFPVQPMETNCDRLCSQNAVFQIADKSISLLLGHVSEYSQVNGILNVITVIFSPSYDLPPGALVIIGGVQGDLFSSNIICIHGPDAEKFACLPCIQKTLPACSGFDMFSPVASLDSNAGEISFVVRAGEKINAGSISEISFNILNPKQINRELCTKLVAGQTACPSLTKLTIGFRLSSQSYIPSNQFPMVGDVLGAGVSPGFVYASVRESNSFSGFANVIQVNFVTNVDLPSQTVLTISSMQGLNKTKKLVVFFDFGNCSVATDGQLIQDLSHNFFLTVSIPQDCKVFANNMTSFSVLMHNPDKPVQPQLLSINAVFIGCSSCVMGCACEMMDEGELLLQLYGMNSGLVLSGESSITILPKLISVLTFVPGQNNVLTMALVCTASLAQESNVIVLGLTGLLSPFVDIQFENGTIFRSQAIISEQSLMFKLSSRLTQGSSLIFNVSLQNSVIAQDWALVSVAVDAAVLFCDGHLFEFCLALNERGLLERVLQSIPAVPILVNSPILDGRPSLYSTSVSILSNVAGSWNVATVAFTANFVVQGPGMLNITGSGLEKFVQPQAATSILLKPELSMLLPNCTCNGYLENYPVDCIGCSIQNQDFAVWQPDKLFGDPAVSTMVAGYWGSGTLSLKLQKGVAIPAGREIVFSFLLLNPSLPLTVTCNISLSSYPSFNVPSALIKENFGVVGGLQPNFVSLVVHQSSTVAGDINMITIQFSVNCPLASFTSVTVTLSGLKGFQSSSGYIPLYGPHAFLVAKKAAGNWSRETGKLVLLAGSMMNRCPLQGNPSCPVSSVVDTTGSGLITFEFSFYLQNPVALNNGGNQININARTSEVNIPVSANAFVQFASAFVGAMTIGPEFLSGSISESRKVQTVHNNISVQLIASVALYPQSMITLSGFENTLSSNGPLSITGLNSSVFAEGNLLSGTVILVVSKEVGPRAPIDFGFTVFNPKSAQLGGKPTLTGFAIGRPVCDDLAPSQDCTKYISSYLNFGVYPHGYIPLGEYQFDVVDFFSATISPSFYFRSISESTNVNFAINTITVTVVSNVYIPSGSDITISGLFPSSEWKLRDNIVELFGPSSEIFAGSGLLISCNDADSWVIPEFQGNTMCKLGNNERRLVLHLDLPILSEANTTFSFKFPNGYNKCCSDSCGANCWSYYSSIYASGANSVTEPYLEFQNSEFENSIFVAGGQLSWIVKNVHESTGVENAMNKLTFTIRPNAPLYPGTQIVISGLNLTLQKSCVKCFSPANKYGDNVPGLGCSDITRSKCHSYLLCDVNVGDLDDIRCTPKFQAIPEFQNMVYYPCLPIFSSDLSESTIFSIPTSFRKGVLNATIDVGQRISEVQDTVFAVFLRNAPTRQSYGAEYQCLDGESPGINCGSKILPGISIITTNPQLCDVNLGADTSEGCFPTIFRDVIGIGTDSPTVDGHDNILRDTCPTCMRQSDLVDFDNTLKSIDSLEIVNLRSGMKIRESLPTLIIGGLESGQYMVYLQLLNWVGVMGTAEKKIVQIDWIDSSTYEADGLGGPMGDEVVTPSAMIEYVESSSVYSDQLIQLNCLGFLSLCLNITNVDNLLFFWSLKNKSGILGKQSSFFVPKTYLNASYVIQFACRVQQGPLLGLESSILISVRIRNLEAIISGAADGGQVWIGQKTTLSARLTFDPESLTTGLTDSSIDFSYDWECDWIARYTENYVPCSTLTLPNTTGVNVVFDSTQFRDGDQVRITLQATRAIGKFAGSGTATNIIVFTMQESETVNVVAIQCNPRVKFLSTCTPMIGNISSVTDPIILQAILPVRLNGQEITSYSWNISDPFDGLLTPSMTLSSPSNFVLILKPGALLAGKPVKFQVSVRDNFEFSGTAEISVVVRIPPYGGSMNVVPLNGTSLITNFFLQAFGWATDEDSMPLTFKYSFSYPTETILVKSVGESFFSFLPPGDKARNYAQRILLDVSDCFGGVQRSTVPLFVFPSPISSVSAITPTFRSIYYPALNSGDGFAALSIISTILCVVNDADIPCANNVGNVGGCLAGDECCERGNLRSLLLQTLKETSESLPVSAEVVQDQASILVALTSEPDEIDLDFFQSCTEYFGSCISSAMQVQNLATADITAIYALILDQLFSSLVALTASSRRFVLLRSLVTPDLYTRSLIWTLLQQISAVSSLAVQQSVPAQEPVIFSSASMTVYTNRLYLTQSLQDLSIKINGTALTVNIPKAFFATIDSSLYAAVDIMLALNYLASALLPESFGPLVVLAARVGNPSQEFVSFEPPDGWGTIEMNVNAICLVPVCYIMVGLRVLFACAASV